jgi:hypothetical protein
MGAENIGIAFKETMKNEWSELRISFVKNRNRSAIGRACLKYGVDEQTMVCLNVLATSMAYDVLPTF